MYCKRRVNTLLVDSTSGQPRSHRHDGPRGSIGPWHYAAHLVHDRLPAVIVQGVISSPGGRPILCAKPWCVQSQDSRLLGASLPSSSGAMGRSDRRHNPQRGSRGVQLSTDWLVMHCARVSPHSPRRCVGPWSTDPRYSVHSVVVHCRYEKKKKKKKKCVGMCVCVACLWVLYTRR